jgi:hypothetical protein
MHRRRENPVGDPPVYSGAAQRGDTHYISDTEKRRRSSHQAWNTGAGLLEIIGFVARQATHS